MLDQSCIVFHKEVMQAILVAFVFAEESSASGNIRKQLGNFIEVANKGEDRGSDVESWERWQWLLNFD